MLQRKMKKTKHFMIKREGEERGNKNIERTLTETPYVWHA